MAVAEGRPAPFRRHIEPQPFAGLAQVASRQVTSRRIFGQTAFEEPVEGCRHLSPLVSHPLRRVAEDRRNEICRGLAGEGTLGRGHLVDHDAEREDVAAVIHMVSLQLFGGHVRQCPDRDSRLALRVERLSRVARLGGSHHRRQTEVQYFHNTAFGDEDVGGLDVLMDDPLGMGGLQRIGNLNCQVEDLRCSQALLGDAVLERSPLQQFQSDERLAHVLTNFVNGADVGMVERGGRACLALEPLKRLPVLGPLLG